MEQGSSEGCPSLYDSWTEIYVRCISDDYNRNTASSGILSHLLNHFAASRECYVSCDVANTQLSLVLHQVDFQLVGISP